MDRYHRLQEIPWSSIARPRRLTIGDLMVGVALAALGCLTVSVTLRSALSDDQRAAFGVQALALFALYAAQWSLASIPARRLGPGMTTWLGIVCYALAMGSYLCLFTLAMTFPPGAAMVVVTMLLLLVYQTTWD